MKLKLLLIAVLVVAGIGAAVLSMGGLASESSATTYLTSTAAIGTVSDDVAATGAVTSTDRFGLAFGTAAHALTDATDAAAAAASSGAAAAWGVASVDVEPGDAVKQGDILATGDPTELQREAVTATSNRRSAQLQLAIADDQLADAKDDGNSDAIRQAQIGYYNAESQLAQARATETDLATQIALANLVAPIDGFVTQVNIVAGSDAPSGDAIVVEARRFEVTTDVVESDISSIAVGQPASVAVAALGEDLEGSVTAIAPSAASGESGGVVSFAVTVRLTNVPAALRPGMSAEVTITTASVADVLTVPSAALRGTDGSYTVRILDASGTPEARTVTVGLVTASLAEIKDGLAAGDVVVTGTASDLIGTVQQRTGGTLTGGGLPGGGAIPGGGGGFR